MSDIATFTLRSGAQMPSLGLGTFEIVGAEAPGAISSAIEAGYRLIDTAASYDNEVEIREGVRRSGVRREELFITTKIGKSTASAADARTRVAGACARLGVTRVDLMLIHGPNPSRDVAIDTWRGLLSAKQDGLVTDVGVSNFSSEQIRQLFDATGEWPAVSQVQLSPALQRRDDVLFYRDHGIVPMAWSPLGIRHGVLSNPLVTRLAQELSVSAAVVALRWGLERGHVVIPKSSSPLRQRENLRALDIILGPKAMMELESLNTGAESSWENRSRMLW